MKPLIYLLQVSVCTGIFYAFYFLFLRRLTFFTVNRVYFMATLFLSFMIPKLTVDLHTAYQIVDAKPVVFIQHMGQLNIPRAPLAQSYGSPAPVINFRGIAILGYYAITIILAIHLVFTLLLLFIRSRGMKLMQIGNVRVLNNKKLGNSSFFNIIFINADQVDTTEADQIIAHEMLHTKLMHSADRMVARVIQVILWFNPFVYLYIRSIEENHEFEVDRIISRESDKSAYAALLLKLAVNHRSYLLHSFSRSPLKKRVTMLFNQPTVKVKRMVYLLAVPLLAVCCLAFSKLITTPQDPGSVKLKNIKRLSALGDLTNYGPHPKVTIDGTEYPDEILYRISPSCIAGTSMISAARIVGQGNKLSGNGKIEIHTLHHKMIYLTQIDIENLEVEASVDTSKFYSKIVLKNQNGTKRYRAIVHLADGSMSHETSIDAKVVFLIDGEPYDESEADKVQTYIKTHKISGEFGTESGKTGKNLTKHDISAYQIVFYFKTDTAKEDKK